MPWAPWLPWAPCAPCGPVAPIGPAGPCGPGRPLVPFVPLVPCDPCGPCGPVEPFSPFVPAVPCGPCEPVAPFRPFVPAGPCGPGRPFRPFVPAVPGEPFSPFVPAVPCGPYGPIGPGTPSGPATPCDPVAPVAPFGPVGPAWPSVPLVPFRPLGPAAPWSPGGPASPCGPGAPAPGTNTPMTSITTSIEPKRLKTAMRPSSDNATVTPFAVAGDEGAIFKLEAFGRATPSGYAVRYDTAVAPTPVRLIANALPSAGRSTHSPIEPRPATVSVAASPRRPCTTPVPSRVSTRRHGVIGSNTVPVEPPAALTNAIPPAPIDTATAAPIAAQRDLISPIAFLPKRQHNTADHSYRRPSVRSR